MKSLNLPRKVCAAVVLLLSAISAAKAYQLDDMSLLPNRLNVPGESAEATFEKPQYACACGCGIFEVGTASMLPQGQGGMFYVEYDYQNQNINWSGQRPSPIALNDDKLIRTSFVTFGLQYFFTREWGIQVELPYAYRDFRTTGGATGNEIVDNKWGAIGDLRLMGIYAGFFEDQSLGIDFGVKLPTGNYKHSDAFGDVDRHTEIGTGCIDLLLGGFFRHQFDEQWTGFAQLLVDAPIEEFKGYRPGVEADGSIGVYYTGLKVAKHVAVVPVGQIIASVRGRDNGINSASPVASGYERVLLSPGLEVDLHPVSLYADIEVPVYQRVNGQQMTAAFMVKVIASYHF